MGEYVFPGIPLVTVWDPDCDCQHGGNTNFAIFAGDRDGTV